MEVFGWKWNGWNPIWCASWILLATCLIAWKTKFHFHSKICRNDVSTTSFLSKSVVSKMLRGALEQPLFDPKRLQQIAEYAVRIWVSLHKRAMFPKTDSPSFCFPKHREVSLYQTRFCRGVATIFSSCWFSSHKIQLPQLFGVSKLDLFREEP